MLLLLAGCGNGDVAGPDAKAGLQRSSEIKSPVQIEYTVIGTPIVGNPVAIDLRLKSLLGAQPYTVSFRVNDPTAMQFPESQSADVFISPPAGDAHSSQQVTVIPLREGRLYLNVSAVIETESGSMQTVTAIPIQVGPAEPRKILENGTVITDADGNLVRSLPAD